MGGKELRLGLAAKAVSRQWKHKRMNKKMLRHEIIKISSVNLSDSREGNCGYECRYSQNTVVLEMSANWWKKLIKMKVNYSMKWRKRVELSRQPLSPPFQHFQPISVASVLSMFSPHLVERSAVHGQT
jgi:hypothetical protein